MCHHSMVTGAAACDGGASDGASEGAATDGASEGAATDGAVVAPPLEQALNTSAMTPMTPRVRQRIVTA